MSTNAHGQDFWVGKIMRSKDQREGTRHIRIADIVSGRRDMKAVCQNYYPESNQVWSRKTKISLKTLATRWEFCGGIKHPCPACKARMNVAGND